MKIAEIIFQTRFSSKLRYIKNTKGDCNLMETISRQEFIDMVAAKSNNRYPKIDLYYIIRDAFWCLEDILRDGNRFEVKGILGIYPEYIEERQYNNFNKGKATVPPHYKPVIKPYSRLKRACEELTEERLGEGLNEAEEDFDYSEEE